MNDLLSDVAHTYKDRTEALSALARIGREALGCQATAIITIDLTSKVLVQEAYSGFDPRFVSKYTGRAWRFNRAGTIRIDEDAIRNSSSVLIDQLDVDGGGIVRPEYARLLGIHNLFASPLLSDGTQFAYFAAIGAAGATDAQRVEDWVAEARLPFEIVHYQEEHRALRRSTSFLRSLIAGLELRSTEEFIKHATEQARELFGVTTCVIWRVGQSKNELRIAEASGIDRAQFQELALDPPKLDVPHIRELRVGYLPDVRASGTLFHHKQEAIAAGWVSLLSAPMHSQGKLTGLLDLYTSSLQLFRHWDKDLASIFADRVEDGIQLTDNRKRLGSLTQARDTLYILLQARTDLSRVNSVEELHRVLLDSALRISATDRGSISSSQDSSEILTTVLKRNAGIDIRETLAPHFGGITSESLRLGQPIRVDDVRGSEWSRIYREFWPDTISELAVPIVIPHARIRTDDTVRFAPKPFGVLNVESNKHPFTEDHEFCLKVLAEHAASEWERLRTDEVMQQIAQAELLMEPQKNAQTVVDIFTDQARAIWAFDYMAVALVDNDRRAMRTFAVRGVPRETEVAMRGLSEPLIASSEPSDIRADIFWTKKIEVPSSSDSRLRRAFETGLNQQKFIRVFMPLILLPDNLVMGTVVAGYEREKRKCIYESDIQGLKRLCDYLALTLERIRKPLLDGISHEINSPLASIRANLSYLQRTFRGLEPKRVEVMLKDLLVDSEFLVYQARQLEYFVGRVPPTSGIEKTSVYHDVLENLVQSMDRFAAAGDDSAPRRIVLDVPSFKAMPALFVDRAQLAQVFYNLLHNAAKYRGVERLRADVSVETSAVNYTINIRDYGIGIDEGCEDRIWEAGFRTPSASRRTYSGTGLGLLIAKNIIEGLGGKLLLQNPRSPTVFQVILPRTLEEAPDAAFNR